MGPISIDLIVLRSNSPEHLKDFYQSILSVQFEHHTDHGAPHYACTLGQITLEIYPSKNTSSVHDTVGFRVESVKATIERVGRDNVYRPEETSQFGIITMLRDTDGRLVHLTQQPG